MSTFFKEVALLLRKRTNVIQIDVSGNSWKKSCKTVCLRDNCNDDIRVEDGFSRQEDGKEKVISCPTCSSKDLGGKKCGEQGGVESRLCPSFANSACFNAETEMKIEGQSSYFS